MSTVHTGVPDDDNGYDDDDDDDDDDDNTGVPDDDYGYDDGDDNDDDDDDENDVLLIAKKMYLVLQIKKRRENDERKRAYIGT